MAKKRKINKPKDRFEEIKNEILSALHGTNMRVEQTQHHIQLVAEQVAGNSEQISEIKEEISKIKDVLEDHGGKLENIQGDIEIIKYDLKEKADNVAIISLSRRVTVLEKKLINKR